jgi:NAD(P)-dependent dehydrogenase (short-subunit alcohol dehydrogenase family)
MGAMDGKICVVTGAAGSNRDIPLGRHAKAEEIARTALFLVSDASSFSTGGVYMADGGMNA